MTHTPSFTVVCLTTFGLPLISSLSLEYNTMALSTSTPLLWVLMHSLDLSCGMVERSKPIEIDKLLQGLGLSAGYTPSFFKIELSRSGAPPSSLENEVC